jgi:hypothetical protein
MIPADMRWCSAQLCFRGMTAAFTPNTWVVAILLLLACGLELP